MLSFAGNGLSVLSKDSVNRSCDRAVVWKKKWSVKKEIKCEQRNIVWEKEMECEKKKYNVKKI